MTDRSYLCIVFIFTYLTVAALATISLADKAIKVPLGSTVDIYCSNKPWNVTMSVIWTVTPVRGRKCTIGSAVESRFVDTCQDGKIQRDTPDGIPYLHIPHVRLKDEGIYLCTATYFKGSYQLRTRLSVKEVKETAASGTDSGEATIVKTTVATGNGNPTNGSKRIYSERVAALLVNGLFLLSMSLNNCQL